MATKGVLDFKGLSNWLEDLEAAGTNVDQAVTDLLTTVQPFVEQELRANLLKTKQPGEVWTGATEATLQTSNVQSEGNYIFIEATAGDADTPQAIYKEFGTPRQAAEPYFRVTFTSHRLKNELKRVMQTLLDRYGLKK